MPFRCKCGRTFEKTDTFASHTSGCAPFHQRRMSESNAHLGTSSTSQQKRTPPLINTSSLSFISTGLLSPTQASPGTSSQASSPTSADLRGDMSSSMPSYFMPTGLSLQYAFEGARRRSMSYGSTATNASLK
ncbi:hypothetical protein RO3G_09661 [Lichtheimia corymbifera JMRC:FSU:9682]|uniref:Uncharacterized protein n=1 Tax=Lichtheimia corymbifera JMRC:FSU:9682 TaxID=1263082 RepID=A0A068S133_9FUNG|nr:hypothetical protein RO3G_09661 [Lichtheimia corymbifera JMRC:FSU:9682]